MQYKKQLSEKYSYIRVTREKLRTNMGKERATVQFIQKYESNRHKAVGVKRLELKQEDGQWKIFREIWKRM